VTAVMKESHLASITESILQHPAWIGYVPGLYAEKLLRGRNIPYLYLLRAGEVDNHYYVTFISSDLTVRHQPFSITETSQGWHFENIQRGGPYIEASIDSVVPLITHCESGVCIPFVKRLFLHEKSS
jgi:hypothetical protein